MLRHYLDSRKLNWGSFPEWGGTQRLPRLVGLQEAVKLCCWGEPIDAEQALTIGLVDLVVDSDLIDAAIGFVSQKAPRRTREAIVGPADLGSFRKNTAGLPQIRGRFR